MRADDWGERIEKGSWNRKFSDNPPHPKKKPSCLQELLGTGIQETGGEAFKNGVEAISELPLSISNTKYSLWSFFSLTGSALHSDNLSHVIEEKNWIRLLTSQPVMLPSPGRESRPHASPPSCQGHRQMSGKTITIPHRCEGGVLLVAWKDLLDAPSNPPWLMHAIFFALTWQGREGCPPARTATQMPKCSCHCIHALIASMPTLSGKSTRIRLQAWCWNWEGKDCIQTPNVARESKKGDARAKILFGDVRGRAVHSGHSSPGGSTAKGQMMQRGILEDLWILKESVAHDLPPMPMFSAGTEHVVCPFFIVRWIENAWGWAGGWRCGASSGVLLPLDANH